MTKNVTHTTAPDYRALAAMYDNNIKHFLVGWFSFRLHITFKKADTATGKNKRHFYGNEHQCTLNQVLAGYVKEIKLDKQKGLTDLINLVEKQWKGKWTSAVIYMREKPNEDFNIVVRKYLQGQLEDEQSPVLDDVVTLYFHGIQNKLPVFSDKPFISEPLPDFKAEIQNNLNLAHATNRQTLAPAAGH